MRHHCLIFFSCRNIHIMVYWAKILVRYRYILHGHHDWLFGFDQCLWNASLSHGKMRQNNELHADLASFLFICARRTPFLEFVHKYYCPELLPLGILVLGLFLGIVQKYSPLNLFSLLLQRPLYSSFLICTSSISNICLKQKTDCISHLKRNWQLFNSQYNSLFKKMQVPGD